MLDNNVDDDDEFSELTDLHRISTLLEACKSYTTDELNTIDNLNDNFSSYFLNLDGNQSNFDSLSVELQQYKNKFSIIGIAETNTDPSLSTVYQLPDYNSFYQATQVGKRKGTGVALYTHKSLNATVNEHLSQITPNLETLFVTISHSNHPITIGVLYRPPSGNVNDALSELSKILEACPKKCVYIMGDFNIDLHGEYNSKVNLFEEITLSTGFAPIISLYTHQQNNNTKKTCIDNILTNDIDSVLLSGTISDNLLHHLPIFHVLNTNIKKCEHEKVTQLYDFCNSNIDNFVTTLETEVNNTLPPNFHSFYSTFNSVIDTTCKLDQPKTTKRTIKNNPWITPSIITSVNTKHKLYKLWKKSV